MRFSSSRWNARLASRTRKPELCRQRKFDLARTSASPVLAASARSPRGPSLAGCNAARVDNDSVSEDIILRNLCNGTPGARQPPARRFAADFTFAKATGASPPIHREISAAMQKAVRKDKLVAGNQHHAADLRTTLEWLREQGDLIETDKPVDPDLEVTGLQKHMDGGCPVLFNNVKGKPNHRVLTNLFGDINVINKMFGWKDDAERVPQARLCAVAIRSSRSGDPAERGAVPGARDQESEGRQRVHGADPAHHLRARAHRRLRHPLRHRRALRWRLRPRLQPHELPLGQCRHVPDLARLAHVAGGQQVLQVGRAGSDHHVLRRAAGLHAARRRRLRLRHPAAWAATRSASPARCRARRSGWSRRAPSTPWRSPTAEIVLEGYVNPRDRRFETKESEDAGIQGRFHFHPEWAGYMGKAYKAPTFHVTAVTMRKPARPSRSSSRSASTRSTTTTSTPRCARRRSTSCATGCSPASCRTW